MFVTAVTSGTFDAAAGSAATADLVIGCVLGRWDFGLQGFTTLAPLGTMWFGLGIMVHNLRLAPRPPPRRAEAFAEQSTDLLMRSLFYGYLSDSNFTEIFSGPNNALTPIQRAVSAVGWKLGIAAEVRSLANPLIRHCDPSEWFGGCHRARGAPPWSLRTLRWFEVSLRRSWLPPSSGSTRWGHRPKCLRHRSDPSSHSRKSHPPPQEPLHPPQPRKGARTGGSRVARKRGPRAEHLDLNAAVVALAMVPRLKMAPARWTPAHLQRSSAQRIGGVVVVVATALLLSDPMIR